MTQTEINKVVDAEDKLTKSFEILEENLQEQKKLESEISKELIKEEN